MKRERSALPLEFELSPVEIGRRRKAQFGSSVAIETECDQVRGDRVAGVPIDMMDLKGLGEAAPAADAASFGNHFLLQTHRAFARTFYRLARFVRHVAYIAGAILARQ